MTWNKNLTGVQTISLNMWPVFCVVFFFEFNYGPESIRLLIGAPKLKQGSIPFTSVYCSLPLYLPGSQTSDQPKVQFFSTVIRQAGWVMCNRLGFVSSSSRRCMDYLVLVPHLARAKLAHAMFFVPLKGRDSLLLLARPVSSAGLHARCTMFFDARVKIFGLRCLAYRCRLSWVCLFMRCVLFAFSGLQKTIPCFDPPGEP